MKKWLAIIIPGHNCSKYIEELLNSVLENNLTKEEYEIIYVDDNSTDNSKDIVHKFDDKIDIKYIDNNTEIHCPGNTREAGLNYLKEIANAEWVTFIDHDDLFENNLKVVKSAIKELNPPYIFATDFREFYPDTMAVKQYIDTSDCNTWLHGRFYRLSFLIDNDIHFKKDLYSHEDVYFNSMCLRSLITLKSDWVHRPILTYKWRAFQESTSRMYYDEKHSYIEKYLSDYIVSCTEPYLTYIAEHKNNPNYKSLFMDYITVCFTYVYFYTQYAIYHLSNETYAENYKVLHNFKQNILITYNLTENEFINILYSNIGRYNRLKQKCLKGGYDFVEIQSLRDFILNI